MNSTQISVSSPHSPTVNNDVILNIQNEEDVIHPVQFQDDDANQGIVGKNLLDLDEQILRRIFLQPSLDDADFCSLSETCKTFRTVISSDRFWSHLCYRQYAFFGTKEYYLLKIRQRKENAERRTRVDLHIQRVEDRITQENQSTLCCCYRSRRLYRRHWNWRIVCEIFGWIVGFGLLCLCFYLIGINTDPTESATSDFTDPVANAPTTQ